MNRFTADTIIIDGGASVSVAREMARSGETLDEVLSRDTMQYKNIRLVINGSICLTISYQDPDRWTPSSPPERGQGWSIKAVAAGRAMFPRGPKEGAPIDGQRDGSNAIGCAPTLIEAIELAETLLAAA